MAMKQYIFILKIKRDWRFPIEETTPIQNPQYIFILHLVLYRLLKALQVSKIFQATRSFGEGLNLNHCQYRIKGTQKPEKGNKKKR
jgi:hypothetical protein